MALAVALLLTAIFSAGFRSRGPWGAWWVFLLIIFLAAWVGGVWITPFGPTVFEVAWLPFLLVGLIFALLLAASAPPAPPRTPRHAVAEVRAEETAVVAFGVFFWLLLLGLIVSIILAYV